MPPPSRPPASTQAEDGWHACGDPGTASLPPRPDRAGCRPQRRRFARSGDHRIQFRIASARPAPAITSLSSDAGGAWRLVDSGEGIATFLATRGAGGWPDLESGGPGFCFPVLRWDGTAYLPNRRRIRRQALPVRAKFASCYKRNLCVRVRRFTARPRRRDHSMKSRFLITAALRPCWPPRLLPHAPPPAKAPPCKPHPTLKAPASSPRIPPCPSTRPISRKIKDADYQPAIEQGIAIQLDRNPGDRRQSRAPDVRQHAGGDAARRADAERAPTTRSAR